MNETEARRHKLTVFPSPYVGHRCSLSLLREVSLPSSSKTWASPPFRKSEEHGYLLKAGLTSALLSGWIIQGPLLMQSVLSPFVGRLSDVLDRKYVNSALGPRRTQPLTPSITDTWPLSLLSSRSLVP